MKNKIKCSQCKKIIAKTEEEAWMNGNQVHSDCFKWSSRNYNEKVNMYWKRLLRLQAERRKHQHIIKGVLSLKGQ